MSWPSLPASLCLARFSAGLADACAPLEPDRPATRPQHPRRGHVAGTGILTFVAASDLAPSSIEHLDRLGTIDAPQRTSAVSGRMSAPAR